MPSTALAAATGLPQPAFLDPRTFPDIYGLAVVGNCMAPDYPDGCNVRISKTEPYAWNDVVVVWLHPEFVKPGHERGMIKRIVMVPPPWVKAFPYKDNPKSEMLALIMLGRDDRPGEMFQVRCSEILAIHKVLGILPEEQCYDARPKASRRRPRRVPGSAVRP